MGLRQVALGAKDAERIAQGEWWRVLASVTLHAGFLHLLLNALLKVPIMRVRWLSSEQDEPQR